MKQRINYCLALIALIAIITATIAITFIFYGQFQNQVKKDLKQNAKLLMQTDIFQNAYTNKDDMSDLLSSFSSDTFRITWIDSDGTVLFDDEKNASGLSNHIDRPEIQNAFKTGEGEIARHSDTFNMDTYYYALLLDNGTVLRVSTEAITILGVFLSALPIIVVISILILLGCVFIGHLLTKQLLRPIREMAENLDNSHTVPTYKELEPFVNKIRIQHENILAAAKMRQDFTANVSHELKTPITAISGYCELMENGLITPESEVHIIHQIHRNTDNLLSLITDIIQLSELDHHELPRTFETVDLYETAKECVENQLAFAAKYHINLSCAGVSASIHADKGLIREMIDNLIQNAVKYNTENGSVRVSVVMTDNHPTLCVKDTGIGISPENQERIFERFYRVDKSRSRETGGTGLGLAIVKHIAQIHSAEISLESAIGKGTSIFVSF